MAISDVGAPAAASGSTGNSIVINLAEEDMAENHDLTPEPIQPQTPDLATNVDEIRAALVAIARHLGVEVPRVTTPAVRVDTPRPSDDAYDEEAVVDLQLREVPSKAPPNIKVQQLTGEYYVRRRGRGLPPNWSVAVGSEESLDPSPGHQHAFAWDLPHGDRSLAFNSVTLWELGYDSQGYVDFKRLCRRPKLVEHIFVTAEGARLDPPWEEQRFGKEWFIRCGLELDPGQLGIVNSQAIEYSQLSRPCYSLLDRFVKAMVLGPKGARVDFCERRVRGTSWSTKQDALNWKAAKIRPLRRGTGMAAFAFRIHCSCGTWATEWSEFLDGIDNASRFDLTDILSHGERLTMMFDDAGSGFALSEFYFTVLQLLRVAHDWIQESVEELKNLAGEFEWQYGPDGYLHDHDQEAAEVSRRNWESVMSHQQSLANGLLSRIAKKREEMSSLRDGLFNATSVREATKSSQLNHYILVFTVVTIFYLPLSFVAALFALDLFKWDAPGQKGSFAAAIVAVAGGTYVCSGLLIWTVRRPERRRTFTRVWIRLWEGCRRRLGWLRRERPVVEDLQRVDSLDGIPGRRGLENSTGVRFAWDLG